jgi:uncharacterized protein (DUF302 family)
MSHGISKTVPLDYDTTLAKLPEALASEGFGILTQVDIQATLRAKLGVQWRRYQILGACNPTLAHKALSTDLAAGLMMPCNVTVYEDGTSTVVTAVDPLETFAGVDAVLRPLAEEVRAKLSRALERLG